MLLAHMLLFHYKIKLNKMHPTLSWLPKKRIKNSNLHFTSVFPVHLFQFLKSLLTMKIKRWTKYVSLRVCVLMMTLSYNLTKL